MLFDIEDIWVIGTVTMRSEDSEEQKVEQETSM